MTEASTAREPAVAARIDEARRLADTGRIARSRAGVSGDPARMRRARPTRSTSSRSARTSAAATRRRSRCSSARAACDADDPVTLTNLGVTNAALGRLDQAIEALRAALRIAPDLYLARLRLGEVIERAGRAERCAAALFRRDLRGARRGPVARRRRRPRPAFARSCCMRCAPSRRAGAGSSRRCCSRSASVTARRRSRASRSAFRCI